METPLGTNEIKLDLTDEPVSNANESTAVMCEICRCEIDDSCNYCTDQTHPPFCKECIGNYIENRISSAFLGTCPTIYCPSLSHKDKKKRQILLYNRWSQQIDAEIPKKYSSLAESVLAFLCGGCHALKSLDRGYEPNHSSEVYQRIKQFIQEQYRDSSRYEELLHRIEGYCAGEYSTDEFYNYIQELLPRVADDEAWEVFSRILKMIPDPERRGNLHLRYLRDRPRMKTLCCNREHCFKCKTKDYHDGKTCEEVIQTLDQAIVACPSCGIAIARGDGCNTITCVCGKQFSWSNEKETTLRSQEFLQLHPEETSTHCAIILCAKNSPPGLNQAKAWQIRHRFEVNKALLDWFKTKYWPCPSQCCAILSTEAVPDGVREAIELWKPQHAAAVTKCKEENAIALRSIFLTLYPDEKERAVAAYKLSKMPRKYLNPARLSSNDGNEVDPKLIHSATKWIETNKAEFQKGVEDYEERLARQFLHLYGNQDVKTTFPCYVSSPNGQEWNRAASNSELTYTNDNTTVERVGSVSCYPAAFCTIPSERATFKVVVEAAPQTSNWLTFGLASKSLPCSSSDGIGRSSNSWGISDDRSSANTHTIVASSGREVGSFRKLQVGDILGAHVDLNEGWVDITVNDDEFYHRFSIPPGTMDDYFFAMSFANDHRVTIFTEGETIRSSAPQKAGELNSDHTIMYSQLKKQIKQILAEDSDELDAHFSSSLDASKAASMSTANQTSRLMTNGCKWAALHNDSHSAQEAYENLRVSIEEFVGIRKVPGKSTSREGLLGITWNNLLEAASWYRINRDRIRGEKKTELGLNFSMIYCEDAAFMAAMHLAEYHAHRVEKDEALAALSYMNMFPDEANAWYDYNAALREPVIDNIARGCRCLPRHMRSCPVAGRK